MRSGYAGLPQRRIGRGRYHGILRIIANASITNNQESGVDEGDIVKAYDPFMVVLLHGRLFSVDTGNKSGALQLVDRIDAYQSKDIDTWIRSDHFDDTLLITGYSYETDSSNIALFHIDHDGKFKFLARYFMSPMTTTLGKLCEPHSGRKARHLHAIRARQLRCGQGRATAAHSPLD